MADGKTSSRLEQIIAVLFLIYGFILITEGYFYPEPGPFSNWHLFYFPFPTFGDFSLYLYLAILLGVFFIALYGFFFLTKGKDFLIKLGGDNIFEKAFFYSLSEGFWAIEALVIFYCSTLLSSFLLYFFLIPNWFVRHQVEWVISRYLTAGLFFFVFGAYKLLPARLQFVGVIKDFILSKKGPAIVKSPTKKQSILAILSLFLFCIFGFFLFTEDVALALNNKEICGVIWSIDQKDLCYKRMAEKNHNYPMCYFVSDPDWKNDCFYWIAWETKNPEICGNIDPDYPTSEIPPISLRNHCIRESSPKN